MAIGRTNACVVIGGELPSISISGLFTGATIPLTYYGNTHDYENNYEYKSTNYNITIIGLDNVATITNNGTKDVSVAFDVASTTTSLTEFTISLSDGTNTYAYKGLYAYYGSEVTGVLTLAYTNIPMSGTGTIGTEYKFIVSGDVQTFPDPTTLWNDVYSYQILNTLIGNYTGTSIGSSFLSFCYSFNQPLTIPSGVTRIGFGFLSYCYSFNQPLTIPSGVTSISSSFLSTCYSFNQPLTIPSGVTSIGSNFLSSCNSFNQPLTIPSGVTSIGSSFLSFCYSFNQPLTIPSGVTSISSRFLSSCSSFNQPLTIPSGVTSIDSDFLSYCRSFNQPLTIPSGVTSIGSNFLSTCNSFNQPLTIPSGVTSISSRFLSYCYSFNQPLTIPSGVTSIGSNFLSSCYSFNQPLTIPSGVTSISSSFLSFCYSLSALIYESAVFPTDNSSLAQEINSKTNPTNGAGIVIYGTNRVGLLTALPNRTTNPFRLLKDGGE